MQILTISDTLGLRGIQIPQEVRIAPINETMILLTLPVDNDGINWTIPLFTPFFDDNWEEVKKLRFIGTAQEILNREEKEMTVSDHFYNGRWEQVRAAVRKASINTTLKNFLIFKIKTGA